MSEFPPDWRERLIPYIPSNWTMERFERTVALKGTWLDTWVVGDAMRQAGLLDKDEDEA